MGNLTKNLSRSEFACNCGCGFDTVDFELVNVLQECTDFFLMKYSARKARIEVTGPNRCPIHNRNEGGVEGSQHTKAKASDFKIYVLNAIGGWRQVPPEEVYTYLDQKYSDRFGLGLYSNRTHIDVRANKARWDKT